MSITKLFLAAGFMVAMIGAMASGSHHAQARTACQMKAFGNHGACSDSGTEANKLAGPPSMQAQVACAAGYSRFGPFLCMTGARGPVSYANAELDCRDISGRVANYIDWRYRIFRGDGVSAPVGWWLGPITADNTALFANSSNTGDFDGETNRFDLRSYACAYTTK